LIDAPEAIQRQRVSQRDTVDESQVQRIIDSQMSRADKQARATYCIENSGSLTDLTEAVLALHHHFVAQSLP